MTQHVMEIVHFGTVPGTNDATIVAAAAGMEKWLRGKSGFVARRLCKGDDGRWVDMIEWRDLASAKAAADEIMSVPEAGTFMAVIIAETEAMTHASIRLSQ